MKNFYVREKVNLFQRIWYYIFSLQSTINWLKIQNLLQMRSCIDCVLCRVYLDEIMYRLRHDNIFALPVNDIACFYTP